MLIIGGSRSGKTNLTFNLISRQSDIDNSQKIKYRIKAFELF